MCRDDSGLVGRMSDVGYLIYSSFENVNCPRRPNSQILHGLYELNGGFPFDEESDKASSAVTSKSYSRHFKPDITLLYLNKFKIEGVTSKILSEDLKNSTSPFTNKGTGLRVWVFIDIFSRFP
ncbi:hypothetical protein BH23BAC3_BH23BAC3_21130 [soil metagenome]